MGSKSSPPSPPRSVSSSPPPSPSLSPVPEELSPLPPPASPASSFKQVLLAPSPPPSAKRSGRGAAGSSPSRYASPGAGSSRRSLAPSAGSTRVAGSPSNARAERNAVKAYLAALEDLSKAKENRNDAESRIRQLDNMIVEATEERKRKRSDRDQFISDTVKFDHQVRSTRSKLLAFNHISLQEVPEVHQISALAVESQKVGLVWKPKLTLDGVNMQRLDAISDAAKEAKFTIVEELINGRKLMAEGEN